MRVGIQRVDYPTIDEDFQIKYEFHQSADNWILTYL